MKYSQSFLTLKGFSATSLFLDKSGLCQFTSMNFHIIPIGFPDASPLKKLFPGFAPENIWKFYIFPDESSSPRWGTETGRFKLFSFVTKKIVPYSRTLYKYSKP